MSAPVFITATGTDAGKTEILCALLRAARARGLGPAVLKPVLSGFDPADIAASDSGRLLAALGRAATPASVAEITPWRFAAPLSPDMAAAREGAVLELAAVTEFCRRAAARAAGAVFIEGAGGVMSPIAQDGLNLDLAAALGARPVLVCGAYLGALSHALTALAAMRAAGAPAALTVMNPHLAGPVPAEDAAATLARFAPETPVRIWSPEAADGVLDALGFG